MSPGEELWSHFNAISNYQQQVICQFDDIKADDDDCHFLQGKNSKPGISPEKWGLYLRETGGGRMREKVDSDMTLPLCSTGHNQDQLKGPDPYF